MECRRHIAHVSLNCVVAVNDLCVNLRLLFQNPTHINMLVVYKPVDRIRSVCKIMIIGQIIHLA